MSEPNTEVEQERQKRVAELVAEDGADWADGFEPGSAGCHELLDRADLMTDFLQRSLLDHPACLANPEWYALASRAAEALSQLYQKVGAVHLGAAE